MRFVDAQDGRLGAGKKTAGFGHVQNAAFMNLSFVAGDSWLAALPKPQTIRQRTNFVRHNQSAEPLRWDSFLAEEGARDLATDRPRRVRVIS